MAFDKVLALNAAKEYMLQSKYQAAIEVYQKIIEADPEDLACITILGDLYVRANRVQDAVREYSKLVDRYIGGGLPRKAIAVLKKIMTVNPGDTSSWLKLADLYAKSGLPIEARQHYLQIAEAYGHSGKRLEALAIYGKVVDLDPSNASTRIKLGELYLREGMNDQAYAAFMTAAGQLAARGERRRALNAYNEALAIRPDSSEALAAVAALTEGHDGLSNRPAPTAALGNSLVEAATASGNLDPVPPSAVHVDSVDPRDSAIVVHEVSKAELLVAYGQVDQAISMLKQVIRSFPDNTDLRIKLKDIYLRNGMTAEGAAECLELERIYRSHGDEERARDYAVRASRLTQLQPSGALPEPGPEPIRQPNPVPVTALPLDVMNQSLVQVSVRPVEPVQSKPEPGPEAPSRIPAVPTPAPPAVSSVPKAPAATPVAPINQRQPSLDVRTSPTKARDAAQPEPSARPASPAGRSVAPPRVAEPPARTVAPPVDRPVGAPVAPVGATPEKVTPAPVEPARPVQPPLQTRPAPLTVRDAAPPASPSVAAPPASPPVDAMPQRVAPVPQAPVKPLQPAPGPRPAITAKIPEKVASMVVENQPAAPALNLVVANETRIAEPPQGDVATPSRTEDSIDGAQAKAAALALAVEPKRSRMKMAAIAAGAAAILGTSAVVGGFLFNSRLEKQYEVLTSAAPAQDAAPADAPPAPVESTPAQADSPQESEQLTVVATPVESPSKPSRNEVPEAKPPNSERPAPSPSPSQPTNEPARPPAPAPPLPRTTLSPDAHTIGENKTPAGVPAGVPTGSPASAPAPAEPSKPRVSQGVVLGGAVKRVEPTYPLNAKYARQAGSVKVEVSIDERGNVTSARAVSGPSILQGAAVAAARGWKFKPSTLGGAPVKTTTVIVFNFKL